MELKRLELKDASALLAFEVENRQWFERHIPPRDEGVYSAAGIEDHIEECLQTYRSGSFYPGLMWSKKRVVARANLRFIDLANRTAHVGYRVGESEAGNGVATAAVKALIEIAKQHYHLTSLTIMVAENNIASRRVAEKCGFSLFSKTANVTPEHLGGVNLMEYRCALG